MANQPKQKPTKGGDDKGTLYGYQTQRTKELARQEKVKADLLEKSVVKVEQVQDIWSQAVAAVRAKLLSLPTKSAPMVTGRTVQETKAILEKQIREALDELSRLRL